MDALTTTIIERGDLAHLALFLWASGSSALLVWRRDGESHADAARAASTHELEYLQGNIAGGEGFDWFYASDADRRAQVRTPITDGAHGESWVWRYKDIRAFWSERHFNRPGGMRSSTPTEWVPGSKPIWLTEIGCGAVDKGANQPNIFGDDKSGENGRPYFSSGLPDGLIQRQVLRAHLRHWADPAHNPPGMVDLERIYCWTWDARPYPAFPALTEVWSDGPNHRNGHWLTGRLGALASDELVSAIAAEHGCVLEGEAAAPLIGGLVIGGPGSVRDAIEPILEMTGQRLLARNGGLVAMSRRIGEANMLDPDKLARIDAPVLSRRRGDVAERPGRLGLGHLDRERDYLSATALAIRPGDGPMVTQSIDMVLDGAAARQAAERLLNGKAASGDRLELALPPSAIALEPGDLIDVSELVEGPFEIVEIRDGLARRVVAQALPLADAMATGVDRPPGGAGAASAPIAPLVVAAHLPAGPADASRTRLVIGAYAQPWPGPVRVTDEATGAGLLTLARTAVTGEVLAAFDAGPRSVWDRGAVLDVSLGFGHLADVGGMAALGGSNRIAVETDAGEWEVIGFAGAELIAPGHYRLAQLLRGLGGTDAAMGPVSAGRRVLLLDGRVGMLPVDAAQIGESRTLRCFAGAADMTGQAVLVSPGPQAAQPLAPVHLRAIRQDDGTIRFTWIRRSRADGDGWGVAEPALEHVPEAWLVRIFDDGVPVRSIETSGATALYGVAEQTADFGGAAPPFSVSVAQLSPVFGPGHAAVGEFYG